MRTKSRKNERNMVQLTLSSAIDQTHKICLEVPPGTSIQEAAKKSGIAPKGNFDVFTPSGEVVSNKNVNQFNNKTLYVGMQKVAGGNDIEIILDSETGVTYHTQPPKKSITFISVFDESVRHEVIPADDQTLRQAAEMAGLAPRDDTDWAVFTGDSRQVNDRKAEEMRGQTLYVGPGVIDAGHGEISLSDISAIRSDYPSLQSVKGHGLDLIYIELLDTRGRSKGGKYRCIIDTRNNGFSSFVLNLNPNLRHPHCYNRLRIPGTNREAFLVCEGNYQGQLRLTKSKSSKFNSYVNHIQSVLNQ